MAFEMLPALTAIVAALDADADLVAAVPNGAHLFIAPQGTPLPYFVVAPSGQRDVYGSGAARVLAMPLVSVQVLVEGTSPAPVQAALDRLDDVLSGVIGQVDGYWLHGITREPAGALMYPENRDDGTHILHTGATYRAHLSSL